jgi:hypothetical protein
VSTPCQNRISEHWDLFGPTNIYQEYDLSAKVVAMLPAILETYYNHLNTGVE